MNDTFDVFEDGVFKTKRFGDYLNKHKIKNWPRLERGQLALDDETFKRMCRHYPQIDPLRTLRKTLAEVRTIKLSVGEDGYNRFLASPYGTVTGRNTPSTSKNIFGGPRWMRALITSPDGEGLAYIDWPQEEVGIAAALSNDREMQQAYQTVDVYLAFAKAAGAIPVGASTATRKRIRSMYKEAQLAINYQMTSFGLQHTLGVPRHEAQALIDHHKRLFRSFWQWQGRVSAHAFGYGTLESVCGWQMQVGTQTKPRTVANFPMQANGAELLRLALIFGREAGVEIAATIHDALLIQAPIAELPSQTTIMQDCMKRASTELLDGFALRSEAHTVTHPASLYERTGPLWDVLNTYLSSTCA